MNLKEGVHGSSIHFDVDGKLMLILIILIQTYNNQTENISFNVMKVDRTLFLSQEFYLFPIFINTNRFLEDLNGKLFAILTLYEGRKGNQYINQKMFQCGQRVESKRDGKYIIELEFTKNYLKLIKFDFNFRQQDFLLIVCRD
jgi:hypothetical protein